MDTIAACKEFLGLNYHEIMKLKLKDFYLLLKMRQKQENAKKEFLEKNNQNLLLKAAQARAEKKVVTPKNAMFGR